MVILNSNLQAVPDGEAVMVVVEVMEEVTEAMEADNLTTPVKLCPLSYTE